MKKLLCLILCILMLVPTFVSCGADVPDVHDKANGIIYKATGDVTNFVIIDVKDYGQIVVELYPDVAPITVENFKKLVSQEFYDGLIFHRVIQDFMIQGGWMDVNGNMKSSATIKGEFSANGVKNDLLHTRGVISMARANAMDSASAQFFIVHKTYPSLDGKYAGFGMTVYGMDVVDAIAAVPTRNDYPRTHVVINAIRFAEKTAA